MNRWVLIIVSVLAVVLCLPVCLQPIRGDAAVFTYAAERMLAGGTLYVDAWDVKSPGIFFQYAAELLIGRSYFAIFFFDLLWAVAAGLMLRNAIARIAGDTAGLMAGASLILAYVALMFAGHMLQPETPALFFMAWLLDISLREGAPTSKEGIAAGVALAALFWLKLPFLLFGIIVLPRLFRAGKTALVPVAASLFAFAVVGALVFGYFAMKNAIPAFIEGSFAIPAKATQVYAFPFAERLSRMGGLLEFCKPIWMVSLFAIVGAVCMSMKWKREFGPLVLLFVAALLVVFVQGRFLYYHWDICALPLAAFAGFGGMTILDLAAPYIKSVGIRFALACVALLIPAYTNLAPNWQKFVSAKGNLDTYWKSLPSYYYTETEVLNLGAVIDLQRKIRDETQPGDTVFPFSLDPSFNIYSERLSPTRFSYLWPLTEPQMEKQDWRDELTQSLIAKPPKVIVLTRINPRNGGDDLNNLLSWPGLREWFQQNYELADIVGPLQTYRWKDGT